MPFLHRLFRFRIFQFRTNLADELEDVHTEIDNLEKSLIRTRLLQRKLTKSFAIYALLLYLIVNVIYFTLFFPQDNMTRLYAVLTSIGIGAILFGMHWLLRWYFRMIIHRREDRLASLKHRKQELFDEVKTKETYAKAKTLLEKYGETITSESQTTPSTVNNDTKNVRRSVTVKSSASTSEKPMISIPPANTGTLQPTTTQVPVTLAQNRGLTNGQLGKLPRAILPPQRSFFSTILDAIVGDGPSKRLICDERLHERWKFRFRYALICKSCNSHNGMALEEEFDYLSYRCAYCNFFNSARKQKPVFSRETIAHDNQSTPSQPQNEPVEEQTEESSSDPLNSNPNMETDIRHRSINAADSESRSRSSSVEHHPAVPSSKENLTKED